MAMLRYVQGCDHDIVGISPATAGLVADALLKYSYIDLYECGDGSRLKFETTVRVSAFAREISVVDMLWGAMLAGALPGFEPPFDLDNAYVAEIKQKAEDYIAGQKEKHDTCLTAIRTYVAECKLAGVKPVKKRVAEQTGYSYDFVREVWQDFDKAQTAEKGDI